MNIKKIFGTSIILLLALVGSTTASAQNAIELTDNSGAIGGQVTFEIRYTDGGAAGATLQFSMTYDNSVFAFNSCAINNPGD